ncbi:MAG: glycoside hydrolase family 127 protein [Lachnospiraceae bacterium]|nr:glycoside hydrolase family 127 protein [Lachnospiraceae bacterium]
MKRQEREADLAGCQVQDEFWSYFQRLVTDEVIPYQEKILNDEIPGVEKSHALENFRIAAGDTSGEFYGMVFQDSDVAKWLEAVAYSLQVKPDSDLEARADAVIDTIGRAQQEDGYLNTYFTVKEPEHRWQNLLECHELYCAGHMMEAAAAYYETTGKDKLLTIMCRMADHIDARFGVGKMEGIPGHEEVELGLLRLYRATGEVRYRRLSEYFINQRGKNPDFFKEEAQKRDWRHFAMRAEDVAYNQSHLPVREQSTAVGHSVRAMYLYTAMADLAGETGDQELFDACVRLWEDTTNRQMYVTGGIGSTVHGEAFTKDYDLPNDTIYAETCASIGLVFFARKMLEISPSARFADVMERCLYNGVLSGMQHDGKRFFYVNPLEVIPGLSGEQAEYAHVIPKRPQWYACACCPPNVARLLPSLGRYAWGENADTIYSHLFVGGSYVSQAAGGMRVTVTSEYLQKGKIVYTMHPATQKACTLAVHIPGWCRKYTICVAGELLESADIREGYCYIRRNWKEGETVELQLELKPRRVYANTAVREDEGCVALMRGPLVYCLEEVDNGKELYKIRIPRQADLHVEEKKDPIIGDYAQLQLEGVRMITSEALYSDEPPKAESCKVRAVPYYLWGNRSEGEMRVWIHE